MEPSEVLDIGGGGIYFWWMIGVMTELCTDPALRSKYKLRGASAGALAAVLGTCQVPAQKALHCAYSLSVEKGIFDRKFGLVGVWRDLVRRWLDSVLPPDAADKCSGKVIVVMTSVPSFRQTKISHFQNKNDLIDACLASIHVPFLMDGRFSTKFRGQRMVDGAIIDVAKDLFVSWLPNSINESRPCSGQNFEKPDHMASLKRISHKDDDRLHHHFRDRGSFNIVNLEDIQMMVDLGRVFGRSIHV